MSFATRGGRGHPTARGMTQRRIADERALVEMEHADWGQITVCGMESFATGKMTSHLPCEEPFFDRSCYRQHPGSFKRRSK